MTRPPDLSGCSARPAPVATPAPAAGAGPDGNGASDRELLEAYAASRDPEALEAFVRRHQDAVLRFASGFLQDQAAAQDVVQETFLRVARRPRPLVGVASPRNWLLRVARNLGVDHLRASLRRRRLAEGYRAERAAAPPGGDGRGEAAELEREELRQRVRDEVAGLRPRLRELVLLRMQEEKSYREIAEITGLTVTNVGYLLHRAMKQLSHRLRDLREEV